MPWIYALLGLLIGSVLGLVISRLSMPNNQKQKDLQKELDKTKYQLEQQKQDLTDHFAQTAEMLDSLGKEYTKLYQHMSKTSAELLPSLPEQDNPFMKKITQKSNKNSGQKKETVEAECYQVPRDYAAVGDSGETNSNSTSDDQQDTTSSKAS